MVEDGFPFTCKYFSKSDDGTHMIEQQYLPRIFGNKLLLWGIAFDLQGLMCKLQIKSLNLVLSESKTVKDNKVT